jgi:hypothetical protein
MNPEESRDCPSAERVAENAGKTTILEKDLQDGPGSYRMIAR